MHIQVPLVLSSALRGGSSPDPTVALSQGLVTGTAITASNSASVTAAGRVNAFLDVPFETSSSSHGTTESRSRPIGKSDGCHRLDIYTPQDAGSQALKPVLFWLPETDSTSSDTIHPKSYGSSIAAEEDLIVVTRADRNCAPGTASATVNLWQEPVSCLYDSKSALHWLQHNIRAFGGDPTQVTLLGQGHGGSVVKQLIGAAWEVVPFHAAIIDSQSPVEPVPSTEGTSTTSEVDEVARPIQAAADLPVMIGSHPSEKAILRATGASTDGVVALQNIFSMLHINDAPLQNALLAKLGMTTVGKMLSIANRISTDALFTCAAAGLAAMYSASSDSIWQYSVSRAFVDSSEDLEKPMAIPSAASMKERKRLQDEQLLKMWAEFARNPHKGPVWSYFESTAGIEVQLYSDSVDAGLAPDAHGLCPLLMPTSKSLGLID